MAIQYTEVLVLLKELVKRGYEIMEVDNTEDYYTVFPIHDDQIEVEKITPEFAYEKIQETDESHVYITKEGKNYWLYFVLGNEPGTALSDYTLNDDIDFVSDKVYDTYNDVYAHREVNFDA